MAQLQEPFKEKGRRGWQQRVRVRKPDGSGWTYKQRGGFQTKEAARAWRDSMTGAAGQRVTLADLIEGYLALTRCATPTRPWPSVPGCPPSRLPAASEAASK